jgi:hypothetical protein
VFTHGIGVVFLVWSCWLIVMAHRSAERVSPLDAIAYSMLVVSGLMDACFLALVVMFGHTAPLGRRDPGWFGDAMQLLIFVPLGLMLLSTALRVRQQRRST